MGPDFRFRGGPRRPRRNPCNGRAFRRIHFQDRRRGDRGRATGTDRGDSRGGGHQTAGTVLRHPSADRTGSAGHDNLRMGYQYPPLDDHGPGRRRRSWPGVLPPDGDAQLWRGRHGDPGGPVPDHSRRNCLVLCAQSRHLNPTCPSS